MVWPAWPQQPSQQEVEQGVLGLGQQLDLSRLFGVADEVCDSGCVCVVRGRGTGSGEHLETSPVFGHWLWLVNAAQGLTLVSLLLHIR